MKFKSQKDIGKTLRELRLDNNFNQSQIAKALSLSRSSYVNMELGRQNIQLKYLRVFCAIYKCKYEYLLGEIPKVEIVIEVKKKRMWKNIKRYVIKEK